MNDEEKAEFERTVTNAFDALGYHDHDMSRDRPYKGQSWTDTGTRGATEVKGITMRDLRDCYIRAVCLSAGHVVPHLYEMALKGDKATLCEADLYGWDFNRLDPMAIAQNLTCEVERLMGLWPNVPPMTEDDFRRELFGE